MFRFRAAAALSGILFANAIGRASEPVVYSTPPGVAHEDTFTVRVRQEGGRWQDLFEHAVMVDLDDPQRASMVQFDMDAPVEVEVRKNNGDVRRVELRPNGTGIAVHLVGPIARFKLDHPAKLSVEFDGDRLHNLHLFASAVEKTRPDRQGAGVVWFGPGIHTPPDQPGSVFSFRSNTTVYLESGAVLRGKIVLDRVSNVRVLGRGIIQNPERGFEITYADNITIDGPIVINPKHYTVYCGQSRHVRIRDLKTFSAAPWSDGLDFMSCSDVDIADVFLRTSDDSIAIYGHRWGFKGDARNFLVQDAILWADVAHPINIGLHGGGDAAPEIIENLKFQHIKILGQDEDDPNYQGTMAISAGDANLVRHVMFDDVQVYDIEEGSLLNLRVLFNQKYSLSPGRGIRDIQFRNIRADARQLRPSVIAGFDAERTVAGVSIHGLTINGRKVPDAAGANLVVGPYAQEVTITK